MKIKDEDIVGKIEAKDGSVYLFLTDKTIYKKTADGKLTRFNLTVKNTRELRNNMELGNSDIVR